MSKFPLFIVFLWLIPAIQVVIPLVMLVIWLILHIPKFVLATATAEKKTKKTAERRKYPRIAGDLIGAMVADSTGKAIGRVKDISTAGICIMDIPKDIHQLGGEVTLRAGENSDFRLLIQPRWEGIQHSGKIFGASIINHPVGWPIFASPTV